MGIHMLRVIKAAHPKEFGWREPTVNAAGRIKGIDRLAGTDQLTKAVDGGTIDALIKQWNADAARFAAMTMPYQLYK
jgi:uncharacterized protein YbbC (DUF1343 family)